jgi:hypothetical protein
MYMDTTNGNTTGISTPSKKRKHNGDGDEVVYPQIEEVLQNT